MNIASGPDGPEPKHRQQRFPERAQLAVRRVGERRIDGDRGIGEPAHLCATALRNSGDVTLDDDVVLRLEIARRAAAGRGGGP